jgi:hypothetical protein
MSTVAEIEAALKQLPEQEVEEGRMKKEGERGAGA